MGGNGDFFDTHGSIRVNSQDVADGDPITQFGRMRFDLTSTPRIQPFTALQFNLRQTFRGSIGGSTITAPTHIPNLSFVQEIRNF